MPRKFEFEHILGVILAVVCTLIGLTSMVGLSSKCTQLRAALSQTLSKEAESTLSVPVSGINTVLTQYVDTTEENVINYLSTTVLLDSEEENEYINEDGTYTGKYIVCTSAAGAYVYSETFEEDALTEDEIKALKIATISRYGVATVISKDGEWCHIVSGDVYGYVKTEDFAFGATAQSYDDETYTTVAALTEEAYLYTLASTASTVLCVLKEEAEYEITAYTGSFYKIYVSGVGEGYIETSKADQIITRLFAVSLQSAAAEAQDIEEGLEEAEEMGINFIWPLPYPYYSNYITSYFGYRSVYIGSSYHRGIDIHAARGTSIYAVADGTVVVSGYGSSEGYKIIIYHGDGLYTLYYHMCTASTLEVGDKVTQGQVIGYVGSTGNSTGNHLHFGVGVGGYTSSYLVDPAEYLGID